MSLNIELVKTCKRDKEYCDRSTNLMLLYLRELQSKIEECEELKQEVEKLKQEVTDIKADNIMKHLIEVSCGASINTATVDFKSRNRPIPYCGVSVSELEFAYKIVSELETYPYFFRCSHEKNVTDRGIEDMRQDLYEELKRLKRR